MAPVKAVENNPQLLHPRSKEMQNLILILAEI